MMNYICPSVGLSINVFRYDELHLSSICGSVSQHIRYDALHLSSIGHSVGQRTSVWSSGVVVKLGLRSKRSGFDSRSRRYDFRDWLFPASKSRYGRFPLKRRKSSVQPTTDFGMTNFIFIPSAGLLVSLFGMLRYICLCICLPSTGLSVNVFRYDALHLSSIYGSVGQRISV